MSAERRLEEIFMEASMTPKKDEYMRGYGDGFKDGQTVGDGPVEIEIDRLRLAAFKTNSNEDKAAYYLAVSKWFQDRHYRAIPSPADERRQP